MKPTIDPLMNQSLMPGSADADPNKLKRDIKAGVLFVRQVHKHRPQLALLTDAAVEEFAGERRSGVVGHAKVELQRWTDRNLEWLEAGGATS